MRIAVRILIIYVAVLFAVLLLYKIHYEYRENIISKITIGTSRQFVEDHLGPSTGVWNKSDFFCNPECPDICGPECPGSMEEFIYAGNPRYETGRFNDNLYICYKDNKVCNRHRSGYDTK